jgi:WhiB family redox-sensing transcriptional regulator
LHRLRTPNQAQEIMMSSENGSGDKGRSSWQAKAACIDENTELFYPNGSSGAAIEQIERAKAVCARCRVRSECRAWAVSRGEYGIWGGTDGTERARIRRALRERHRAR